MSYRVGRVLGQGGNAIVYDAVDRRTNQRVALKVLTSGHADRLAAARLGREARTGGAIRHPNVCATLDAGVLDDGRAFVAMERLEGESLRHLLLRDGRLEPEQVLEIGVQILAGLQAAHDLGVLHRDVKPENVFLHREDGQRVTVKLLDFGACRMMDHTLDSQTLTLTGFVVGTPGYLAPEQAYGDRVLGASADLFAVGLILFEVLTGRPGFLGRTNAELMDGVRVRVPRVARYRTVHALLDAIVAKATEPDARDRYGSAAEMMHDLLEARTAMRHEGYYASKAKHVAPMMRTKMPSQATDSWDLPTQRYVA
jgi:serine/threonine-protein kinase